MVLPYRDDCIVINEFVIYPTGAIYLDNTLVFKTEEAATVYIQREWYDRYGEENVKVCHRENSNSPIKTRYNYVEVSELGLGDRSDISRRCFTAQWCSVYKKSELK